ncbi:MAG: hypothetical protein N2202_07440 [Proteobacteria bacterium]|nr:hypothetical protein [Pseudomonadota bacterium]
MIFIIISLIFINKAYSQSFDYGFRYKNTSKVNGEFSLSVGQLNFTKEWKSRAYFQLEMIERTDKYGIGLGLGWANIDSERFIKDFVNYRESLDFIPVELNVKRFFEANNIELGIGIGVSMNFLNYNLDNLDISRNLESKLRVLFGAQGMMEIKMLFPSSYGRNAFAGIEGKYQWVDRANTFLDSKDLTNYRIILKLGGIF